MYPDRLGVSTSTFDRNMVSKSGRPQSGRDNGKQVMGVKRSSRNRIDELEWEINLSRDRGANVYE